MSNIVQYTMLFVEQVALMCLKHVNQKIRNGRQWWKDTIMIQFFLLGFTVYIMYQSAATVEYADVYNYHSLPPLSAKAPWGIFNIESNGNTENTLISKTLYYSPDNHAGVNYLIGNLTQTFPSIKAIGAADQDAINSLYEENLFDTWASVQFNLTAEQIQTGDFVIDQNQSTVVSYAILMTPVNWGVPLSTSNYTDTSQIYNDQQCDADLFWSTGYMTLENYVTTFLAKEYNEVPQDFTVDTYIQRYAKSPIYEDQQQIDITSARYTIWAWIGGTVLSICLFTPALSLLTEIVRERQYRMKDILEISGLMNGPYWASYGVVLFAITQVSVWFCLLFMWLCGILTQSRMAPYGSLLTIYSIGSIAYGMAFGFLVPRAEYFGLPAFILSTALTAAASFMAADFTLSVGLKLFVCFLHPSLALAMGVLVIEGFFWNNGGSSKDSMDIYYVDESRQWPCLAAIQGVMWATIVVYVIWTLGYPFEFLWKSDSSPAELLIASKSETETPYPCDSEENDDIEAFSVNIGAGDDDLSAFADTHRSTDSKAGGVNGYKKSLIDPADVLLNVDTLSHVYPDGTHAVKDISFKVKKGEVLSFLGANGAGKSTTMGMLCGTLDATFGDAIVNGYSISNDRTMARRNLGIAMQQDIIWDDVSVQDHLMLFGRLRGLHGAKLREDVKAMLESLGFPDKARALAGTLSGGQKRRLCVGLSMVGGNSVVYLDEPTAGLDPVSRRQLWELVEKNREGRAILLTTHFMDEADVLGDRIAIVKEGRMRAVGTAKYLKKKFGMGYLLRMSLEQGADASAIAQLVNSKIPTSTVASSAGTELSVRLPTDAVPQFPELFTELEEGARDMKMLSYGIETTTLEEVFMRIVNEDTEVLLADHKAANKMLTATAEERDAFAKKLNERDNKRNPISEEQMNMLLTKGRSADASYEVMSVFTQANVMFQKRCYQFGRSRGQWSMGMIVPFVVAILIGLLIEKMPQDIIGSNDDLTFATYTPAYTTPIAGPEPATYDYVQNAFGDIPVYYTGEDVSNLQSYVNGISKAGAGDTSTEGIAYTAFNNFSVLYNSSYPVNFGGAVQHMLEAATSNVTKGKLIVKQSYASMPPILLFNQLNSGFFVGLLSAVLAGAVGAGMSIVVGGERVSLVKHQQLASGASKVAYWMGNFMFDLLLMTVVVLIVSITLICFRPHTYNNSGFGYVFGTGIFFAVASIFRFYIASFFVSDIKMAQSIFFYGSLFVMYCFLQVWFITLFVSAQGDSANPAVIVLSMILTIIEPTFGWMLIILYQANFIGVLTQNKGADFLGDICMSEFYGLLLAMGVYVTIFVLFMEGGFYSLVRAVCCCFVPSGATKNTDGTVTTSAIRESIMGDHDETLPAAPVMTVRHSQEILPVARRAKRQDQVPGMSDPDVVEERQKVQDMVREGNLNPRSSAIFIYNLRKIYYARGNVPSKVAVKDVSVSIGQGEVFGLLGANGAGKTTLLKMVSGQEKPTSGCALINGYDVVTDTSRAQRSMGLCPQFDTLVERLSVKENLLFFGQIKGLSGKQLTDVVEAFMVAMNIKRYERKLIMQLSGGNRRKVSLAVALLGAPPTVYLDEPSTGLDPVASRLMWRLLSKISEAKTTAIVLTTHNMLECEAVCTRICIMKLGEMVCLGDSQHLRSAHGTGFLLEITLQSTDRAEAAKDFVERTFENAVVVDEHATMLNFEIPKRSIAKLSEAFRIMEDKKESLGVIDYALSQSTLEQVFLKQIRPTARDLINQQDQQSMEAKVPRFADYATGYAMWVLAALIPGAHHFYLGNTARGFKYLFTLNEVFAGWFLDLFEMHILIQKSVQEHGNIRACCYCWGCAAFARCCCCCCMSKPAHVTSSDSHQVPRDLMSASDEGGQDIA